MKETKVSERHPLGMRWNNHQEQTCGRCFWARYAGPGPKVWRCTMAGQQRISEIQQGCELWEAEPDCLDCAACCGPAYDAVEIGARDPVRQKHADIVQKKDGRYCIRRTPQNRCVALLDDNRCRIYSERPRCCRGFEKGSVNCLFARQRLGFTKFWTAIS